MIDISVSQSKQTAELLCSFREPPLTDAYYGRAVMGYHRHSQLHYGALKAFITYLSCAAREQTGDVTFHNWSAVATGKGEVHLVWSAFSVQACFGQTTADLLLGGRWWDGCDCLGDTNSENPPCMQGLAQGRIIDTEIPSHRMDREPSGEADVVDGPLNLINHGQDVTGIARIARWHPGGKDKAGRGFREQPRFAAKLGWAIAFAFENGRNGPIVSIDDFAVVQLLALGQAARLCTDSVMGLHRCLQLAGQAVTLTLSQRGGPLETVLRGLCEGGDGAAQV